MKYKVTNKKGYVIAFEIWEFPAGETVIDCTKYQADLIASSNGLVVEKLEEEPVKKVKKGDK